MLVKYTGPYTAVTVLDIQFKRNEPKEVSNETAELLLKPEKSSFESAEAPTAEPAPAKPAKKG